MHCDCCDKLLTYEETRIRFKHSGAFANTCRSCLDTMDTEYTFPRPSYEEEVVRDAPVEEDDPYQSDYWNER